VNLLDEIQEARQEFLQDAWDRCLVETWKEKPSIKMGVLCYQFGTKYKLKDGEIFSLKRVPKFKHQINNAITRFIAAYLPTLSTCLWNGNKTFDELVLICSKSPMLINPADAKKVAAESNERFVTRRKYNKHETENMLSDLLFDSQKRSNWGVAKGRPKGKR
jgi:hypothetical protein